jgi:uncharacterized protein
LNQRPSAKSGPMNQKKSSCIGRIACLGIAIPAVLILILAGLFLYARKIEPHYLEVTRNDVKFENYPEGAPPLRIVLIGDTHYGKRNTGEFIDRVVRIMNTLDADIVILDGDFNSRIEYATECANSLGRVKSRLGTYAVFGGHDFQQGPRIIEHDLAIAGIPALRDQNINIFGNVWLIAVADRYLGKPDVDKAFRGVPENAVRIVDTHDPGIFPKLMNRNCFVMAAHTHGGQVDIPGIPRNQLPGLLRCEYIRGWYHDGNSRLYVNRGIATVGVYLRFRVRPEISLFTISRGTPVTTGMKAKDPINKNSPLRRFFMLIIRRLKPAYMKELYDLGR